MTSRLPIALVAVLALGAAVVVAWLLLHADTGTYRVPSEAMAPTLPRGGEVTVNEDAYDDRAPKRGDVVVFHPPAGAAQSRCGVAHPKAQMCPKATPGQLAPLQVKRVAAVAGDRLTMDAIGTFYLDGVKVFEYMSHKTLGCPREQPCAYSIPVTVPPGTVFVVGDNRAESDDSRFWGPVRVDAIVGRVDKCIALGLGCHPRD